MKNAKERMKENWGTGSAAGEQFGLMVRQKVIGFFKRLFGGGDAKVK